jgi:predicted phage-related endonuclease
MTQYLVDELAVVRQQIKDLQDRESDIRAAILKMEQNIVEGERFTAILKLVPSTRLDTKAVKKEMGESWVNSHSVSTSSIRIEVIRKCA